jgi:hypothetical protein
VDSLPELAPDMRWSWNHSADEVWRQPDPARWDLTHNSWVVLQLFADVANGTKPEIMKMQLETKTESTTNEYCNNALASSKRPTSDYTQGALTEITGVSVPLESTAIKSW